MLAGFASLYKEQKAQLEHKQAYKKNTVDEKCTGKPKKMFSLDLGIDGQQGFLLI